MERNVSYLYEIRPEKLVEAREARGYNASQFADILKLSRQAISKYEKGTMKPSPEVLQRYIDKLDFPLRFFQQPTEDSDNADATPVLFRSFATASARERKMVEIRSRWIGRISDYLNQYVDYPMENITRVSEENSYKDEDIEDIADGLRRKWGLGSGPISNMTVLMENQGAIISRAEVCVSKSDACSKWRRKRPYVILTADKNSSARSRFDLAHELGHFILHNPSYAELQDKIYLRKIEKEANRFASAFLLPRESFAQEVISTSLDYFVSLKERWNVSIAAMIYRCNDLGILSETQTSYLWRQMASNKFRTREPLDNIVPVEQPLMLRESVKLLLENNIITVSDIKEKLGMGVNDISEICNVPISMLKEDIIPERPRLQIVK